MTDSCTGKLTIKVTRKNCNRTLITSSTGIRHGLWNLQRTNAKSCESWKSTSATPSCEITPSMAIPYRQHEKGNTWRLPFKVNSPSHHTSITTSRQPPPPDTSSRETYRAAAKCQRYQLPDICKTSEYATTVWDPVGNKTSQQKLEAEQNRCARFAIEDYWRTSSITAIKEQLQWESLAERSAKARAPMVYRIINHLVFTPQGLLTPSTVPSQARGALYKLPITPHAQTSTRTTLWHHHLFCGMALMQGSQKRRPSRYSGPN